MFGVSHPKVARRENINWRLRASGVESFFSRASAKKYFGVQSSWIPQYTSLIWGVMWIMKTLLYALMRKRKILKLASNVRLTPIFVINEFQK